MCNFAPRNTPLKNSKIMTKEEYATLLASDYWRGFSYSLIKERNFTCADCGRSFPNQRNMLNVHHLCYRDAKPWAYDPSELIVLCRDCHQRRHGIEPPAAATADAFATRDGAASQVRPDPSADEMRSRRQPRRKLPNPKWILVLFFIVVAALIWSLIVEYKPSGDKPHKQQESYDPDIVEDIPYDGQYADIPDDLDVDLDDDLDFDDVDSYEAILHQQAVEEARRAGVSTKGSTSDIYERILHQQAVEEARRAGVSTKGSTSDIYERILHQQAVEEARRAGVSTEGSTSDIYERMLHKEAVEDAKRAGVSTEGSTSDIYERMLHKEAVEDAKRAGVSTEGSTSDIYERILRKETANDAKRTGAGTKGSTSGSPRQKASKGAVKEPKSTGVSAEGSSSNFGRIIR